MTTKRRPSAAAAAALVVATLLLLAQAAPSATAATPATSSKHNSNNKNKAGPSGLAACTKATGVPGCVACVPAGGGGHKSAAAKKFTCTRCEGAGYETKPVKGVCSCSIGYGRLPLSPATSSSSSAAPAPAHSGGKSSGGKSSGKGGKKKTTPTPTLAPCSPCPQGTVSGSFSDNCVACAAGYEPYGGASCVAACTPFSSCAEAGASCGPVDNGCGTGVLECGSCASGQTCDSVVRRCACPDGSLPPADTPSSCPLGGARLSCASDAECASSICDSQVCVDACPPNSQPAAGSSDGCVCSPDSFSLSIGGKPPCAACGGGSFAPTPGSARCECAPPRVWSKPLNGCACQTSGEAYVNGECRMTGDPLEGSAECTTDGQCASADCDATLNPAACSPKLCADGTAPSGDSGACLCAPGTWSANGQAPCFPCGAGASSAAYGSTFCTCQNPIGSAWSQTAATGGRCLCPDGRVPTLLTPKSIPVCLLKTGEDCAASSSCASGICEVSSGSCIDQCPPNATLDVAAGRCRCIVNYFGAATGGDADCSPCTGDATTNGLTGQTACSCPPGKGTWSLSGACVCGPGEQKQPSTGLCLAGDLRLCERNEQCASNVCETATGICGDAPEAPPCPPNSEPDGSGSCRCLPGSFGDGATCTRCGAGSYAPLAGSAACECSSPVGSIWSLSTNSCACLDGQTVVNGECLVSTGGSCPSGDACASALCSGGVCVAACPPGSEAVGGSCVCSVGYYSSTGEPSCVACGGGSLNVGTGNTACRCNLTTGEVWNHVRFFVWARSDLICARSARARASFSFPPRKLSPSPSAARPPPQKKPRQTTAYRTLRVPAQPRALGRPLSRCRWANLRYAGRLRLRHVPPVRLPLAVHAPADLRLERQLRLPKGDVWGQLHALRCGRHHVRLWRLGVPVRFAPRVDVDGLDHKHVCLRRGQCRH